MSSCFTSYCTNHFMTFEPCRVNKSMYTREGKSLRKRFIDIRIYYSNKGDKIT